MSLGKKAIRGLLWTFGQQFSIQAINFVVQLILARLLLPEDFGLIAMLSVFIAVGTSLVDSGLTISLIRTTDADQRDYSTVFFANLAVSIVIYGVLFCLAPFIASFFEQPKLTTIIRVYTATFVIRAFSQVQQTKLTKEMNFRLQMLVQVPSVLIAGVIGVIMAFKGLGVWALVYMNILQVFISTVQLWFRTGWFPSWQFDICLLKRHFGFGYKLALAGILNTVFTNMYNIVIGKFFAATQLGFYNRADALRMFPIQNLAAALNKVTYSTFAAIKDDDKKLKAAYRMVMQQVMFWLSPLIVILIILARPLFTLILTDKWLPSVPLFQWLCVAGLLYPLHSYNLNILNVKGRSDLFLRLEIIKKLIIVVGVFLVIPHGIYGLIYFQIFSSVTAYFINSYYSGKLIGYSSMAQLIDLLPTLLLCSFIGALIWILYQFADLYLHWPDWANIFLFGSSFFIIYLCAGNLLHLQAYKDFRTLILKR